jgi:type II secretory pathway pseudopilin PulG
MPAAAQPRRRKDSGFALLLIFLMASLIAISLYMEMPRVAFQAERQREQLLMERGEQYKRAIGLFVRTNKTRWPASIEELESFNNHRYLRRRYADPITGKDEWRLIHIQNGVLQDSVLNKKTNNNNANDQAHLTNDGFITELQGLGQQPTDATQATNPALRRRQSEGGAPELGPDGQPLPAGATGSAGLYPGLTPLPGTAPPAPPFPGVAGTQGAPTGPVGIPGLLGIPSVPGSTGQTNAGGIVTGAGIQSVFPGAPPGFVPGVSGIPATGQPGTPALGPGGGQPGVQINAQAQQAAANLLGNLLTSPRPGGLAGITSGQPGGIMGGGIAGVASKAEGEAIMVYSDRTDFSEWEFIYDPMKFRVPPNPNSGSGGGGVPASQLASNVGGSSPGTPIGTGPGGTQPSAAATPIGQAFGQTIQPGQVASSGAPGVAGATGATSPGASAAFGQAGGPDIRPGKK